MIHWLHVLPDMVIFAGVIVLVGTAMLVAPRVGARVLRFRHDSRREELAFDAFKVVAATTSLILGFSLVQVDGNLRNEQLGVGREAAAFSATDLRLSHLGGAEASRLRASLRLLAGQVVDDEWPAMTDGGRSQAADRLFEDLSARLAATAPAGEPARATVNRAINGLDEMARLREARLSAAATHLPPIYWWAIAILLGLMLALATLTAPGSPRSLAAAMIGAAIGLLIALVAIIDGPFDGALGVGPGPVQQAIVRSLARG